ncbi:MAG TPA: CoA pyrophosphatase [Nocardia sp.]|uniref:NUDIX hydrolase n=1 Tax=Nocardia TaxID=1817 RepID=UPI002457280E|nr:MULTISPECIES: CoA pyrophosphatase [Nocardia]HLS77090.1 CoA pyrophosphatase [Nocardia sp.]
MSTASRPRHTDDPGEPDAPETGGGAGQAAAPDEGPSASALAGLDIAGFRALAAARLERFPRLAVPDAPGMRRAAVVLCVLPAADGTLAVLVIKRAYRGRNAGQWGLPGGRMETGETAEQAALRELHEELALPADPDDILGVLDDFPATSGFAITPVVVTMPSADGLRPHPDEVHSVHHVSLTRLAAPDVPHWLRRDDFPDGPDLLQMRLGPKMTIHAPTGAMLWQFREAVLLEATPEQARVAHFAQPEWTRR